MLHPQKKPKKSNVKPQKASTEKDSNPKIREIKTWKGELINGHPLTPEQEIIAEAANKYILDAGAGIDEAAKQVCALSGLVQGILIAVFAFGSFQTIINDWKFIPFVTAVISLLGSFIFCAMVYTPLSDPSSMSNLLEMHDFFSPSHAANKNGYV